jgi:large repetitive protein
LSLFRRVFFIGVAAVVASTCGGGGGDVGGPPTLTSVTVTGDSTVVLNGIRVLTAQAMAGGTAVNTGVTYTWSASNASVSIAPNGAMASITGLTRGLVTITVQASTSAQPSGPSRTHALRVRIGSVVVTPTPPTMTSIDDTVRLTAEARDAANAAVPGVTFTWQSGNNGVASVAPVNATQADLVAEGNGNTLITVTGDGVSEIVNAVVAQVATTLNIVQTDTTVDRINAQFTPTVQATDARGNPVAGGGIAWASRDQTVAIVNGSGLVMAVNEDSTYIVATSNGLADSVLFRVALVYGSVSIMADTTIRRLNGTRQLAAQVRDVGNTVVPGPQLTWSFKTGGIATVDPSTGLVTGGSATGSDSVIATARTVADTALFRIIQVTATVAVTPKPAGENLNFVGDTLQFAAAALDSGGSAIPSEVFTWSSSNTGVFDVNQSGVVSAVANGTARVRALAGGGGDSVTVVVARVPVFAALSPGSFPDITAINDSLLASCVVEDSAAVVIANHPCNWILGTPGVVAVRPNPAASTYIVALTNGNTSIEARAATGVSGFNSVQVQQEAALISLHPQTIDTSRILASSGTVQFVDTAFDANGFLVSPAPTITWSSSDGSRASVNASGLATAGATTGTVYIRAASGTALDSSLVIVTNTPVTLAGSVQPIFTGNCAVVGCHAGPTPQQGQNLSSGQAHSNIVDVGANESTLDRAEPFQPDFSYLVHKIQGTHLLPPANGIGERMPFGCSGAGCLSKGQINQIRNWILQGAANN